MHDATVAEWAYETNVTDVNQEISVTYLKKKNYLINELYLFMKLFTRLLHIWK